MKTQQTMLNVHSKLNSSMFIVHLAILWSTLVLIVLLQLRPYAVLGFLSLALVLTALVVLVLAPAGRFHWEHSSPPVGTVIVGAFSRDLFSLTSSFWLWPQHLDFVHPCLSGSVPLYPISNGISVVLHHGPKPGPHRDQTRSNCSLNSAMGIS